MRCSRRGVEADLGVGEVAVVDEEEVGAAALEGVGGVGGRDVEFESFAQDEVGGVDGVVVVGADGDAVGAGAVAGDGE